jgi:Domain of unknown function (DUF4267)
MRAIVPGASGGSSWATWRSGSRSARRAWAAAGPTTLGWVLVAAAITPTADALIVLTNDGKPAKALGIHGLSAALLVAAGLVLALA